MAIPESLNKQDYWYRVEFGHASKRAHEQLRTLTFDGINYAAEVWLNGKRLGDGDGRVSARHVRRDRALLKPVATNALAVRISPPPHPGIPQEQSI